MLKVRVGEREAGRKCPRHIMLGVLACGACAGRGPGLGRRGFS